ncbi:hypothetical protein GCM10010399_26790 [Dactylosporangium fulvum]|uniref:Winged helix-turn-helix domain-containing protein n=1 Tax=Dactylosporangium fulvum TaxID=53359 RepID=A0ABY5VTC2_9ACTN|nr:winged helix-turn-helix domain-containing protein [Dactylosporangium fulvum]UWP80069.1 winged helix-turn-helix domain-containing protein [Dactylosporangium fulvum]
MTEEAVEFVRWPRETGRRQHFEARGVLRILLVDSDAAAPICADPREDWVRVPVSRQDLLARMTALRIRAQAQSRPCLTPGGLLRMSGRSVPVSPTECGVLELFVAGYGHVVNRAALEERITRVAAAPATRNALDLHIKRLRRRVEGLGLQITTVRGHGYILQASGPSRAVIDTADRQSTGD